MKHGALLDSELLAEVYLELIGGREPGLSLAAETASGTDASGKITHLVRSARPTALPSRLTEDEKSAHQAFIASFGEEALWKNT